MSDDLVAITGISGRFPKCSTMDHLKTSLLEGIDLVTDNHSRWPHQTMNLPPRLGIVENLDRFDAEFFGTNPKQADSYDPRTRQLLEVVFEAIVDSGHNPSDLKGSNTGVFLAATQSEAGTKLGILSRSTSIMANTISYVFDLNGSSFALDSGCSSGLYVFSQAVDALENGNCDMALVCGAQLQLDPDESKEFAALGVLSPEGICKTFDEYRNGYVKADGIVAVLLQKVKDSRRIYATIAGCSINSDGFKPDGLIHPSGQSQMALIQKIYNSHRIRSKDVVYVEAHGTGTKVGDLEEIQALAQYFFQEDQKGREPLLVGSVKSNLGHGETASGLVSLAKLVLSIQGGIIPGNLHYKTPGSDLVGIQDGRIKVVDKNTLLNNGLLAVNSFGFGGTNAHLVLRPFLNSQENDMVGNIGLIGVSGRTEEAVECLLTKSMENRANPKFLSLLSHVFRKPIENHNYRGYALLFGSGTMEICESPSKRKRPIWFLYSGMGSQWAGMAKDLTKLEVFRNTLKKCADAVRPFGLDLEDLMINGSQVAYDDVINCFTAITAMSVCLTDVLTWVGVKPDCIIGHSLGEVGCAYADGLITAEQATLIGYGRGYATANTSLTPGLMVSVGLSAEDCKKLLPEHVYIACDNSQDNVTVSGPEPQIQILIEHLTKDGIFHKIVNTAHIAFHCKHIHEAGPKLLNFLKTVIPTSDNKLRSSMWLPSAIIESEWSTELGQYNSAEYHCHNFMNMVRFRQVLEKTPKDAIVVEIAPRGLLRAILRRNLDTTVTKLSLSGNEAEDNLEFLLSSLGQLYNAGCNLDFSRFYGGVTLPVDASTPFLGSLIRWDHSYKWDVPSYDPERLFGERVLLDTESPECRYLQGHVVDGKVIYPGAGYFVMVWRAFAKMLDQSYLHLPIVLTGVKIFNATLLTSKNMVKFMVNIFKSGKFEISSESGIVATGRINTVEQITAEFYTYCNLDYQDLSKKIKLSSEDFYKELHLRGYDYSDDFRGVMRFDLDGTGGALKWVDNWVTFLDTIMHHIVFIEQSGLFVPNSIEKIVIDPQNHLKLASKETELSYNKFLMAAKCGGVEIRGIHGACVRRRAVEPEPTLQKYQFVPNFTSHNESNGTDSVRWALSIIIQLVIENITTHSGVRVAEISDQATEILKQIEEVVPRNIIKKTTFENVKVKDLTNTIVKADIVYDLALVPDITQQEDEFISNCTKISDFFLTQIGYFDEIFFHTLGLEVIHRHSTSSGTLVLFRRHRPLTENYIVISVLSDNFLWVEQLKLAITQNQSLESRIYLIAREPTSGVVGFFNCIKTELSCPNLRIFFMKNCKNETFSVKSKFYENQLRKDLTVNIYQDGIWGSYKLLPFEQLQKKLTEEAQLLGGIYGHGTGLEWVQSSPHQSCKQRISVHFASMNACDVQTLNSSSIETPLGVEYSGLDESGNKVMGLTPEGSVATFLKPHHYLTWKIPYSWSLENSATAPLCYTLAWYGLHFKAHVRKNDIVLIHGGTTVFNIATIHLILHLGCEVYVPASSRADIDFLETVFMNSDKAKLIDTSGELTLDELLVEQLNSKKVDVVINCQAEQELSTSLKFTSESARFLQIARDNQADHDLFHRNNCQFFNVNLKHIWRETNQNLLSVSKKIEDLIKEEAIVPLRYGTFDKTEVDEALRKAEQDQKAKYLVKLRFQNSIFGSSLDNRILAQPRSYFDPTKCYVLIGGLGGFGLELANWMISRGASQIILNSRTEVSTGYQALCLQKWKEKGVEVRTNTSDSTSLDGAENLLNYGLSLGPIGGIFNTALVLKDEIFTEQCMENFRAVIAPKLLSTQNMDFLSRKRCPYLKHFVIFSSMVSSLGNQSQSNYGFANSAIERLCECRKAEGLPALAVQWGPVGDVGFVHRLRTKTKFLGAVPQGILSCLNVLDQFLQQDQPVVSSCVHVDDFQEENMRSGGRKTVLEAVAEMFGVRNIDLLDGSTKLVRLGMDSLLSFEIKHMLERDYNVDMGIQDVKNLSIEDLRRMGV